MGEIIQRWVFLSNCDTSGVTNLLRKSIIHRSCFSKQYQFLCSSLTKIKLQIRKCYIKKTFKTGHTVPNKVV